MTKVEQLEKVRAGISPFTGKTLRSKDRDALEAMLTADPAEAIGARWGRRLTPEQLLAETTQRAGR